MRQIGPREITAIVRQIDDPADTDTYYVQAVIRNARTNATVETVNLTDQGGQRFSKEWQAPADTSGQGLHLDITTTVYTDAGYTTKSENYGIEREDILIQDRMNPKIHLGGGGGVDVNYKKIRQIAREEIAKIPDVEIPEPVDITPILRELSNVRDDIGGIVIPETDLSEVTEGLRGLRARVERADVKGEVDDLLKKMVLVERLYARASDMLDVMKTLDGKLEDYELYNAFMANLAKALKESGTPLKIETPEPKQKRIDTSERAKRLARL